LIGERGVALVGLDPDGIVEVQGARWRATTHREAKVATGTEVVVNGVDGLFLEVDRVLPDREN
jgi:membrane-bound ClpP family serine protease